MSIFRPSSDKIEGVFVALVTPYHEDLSIDWATFEKYIDWLCSQGIHGLVPCGTTGEFLALTSQEQRQLIRRTVDVAQGRVRVIAGAGSVTLPQTIEYITAAREEGAEAVLTITPYYIKPSQEGLYDYYCAISEATQAPLILYNNPGRSGVELSLSTITRLCELPSIIGIKESSSDLSRPLTLLEAIESRSFTLLSGEDTLFLPFLAAGGHGTISATAGIAPRQYIQLWKAWSQRDLPKAQSLASHLLKFTQALFFQVPSAIALKYAYSLLGWGHPYTRLPVGHLSQADKDNIKKHVAWTCQDFDKF